MVKIFIRYESLVSYVLIAGLLLVLGSGGNPRNGDHPNSVAVYEGRDFWAPLRIDGDEVEDFTTLSAMTARADSVIRGRIVGFTLSRTIQGDAAEDVVSYTAAKIQVLEKLRGAEVGKSIVVELPLSAPTHDVAPTVAAQAASIPEGEMIVFLHRKRGRNESDFYRPVSSVGLWVESPAGLETPLVPDNDESREVKELAIGRTRFANELSGAKTIPDLAKRIAAQ